MLELLLTMLERLGLIVTIAFILTRFRFFREMIYQESLTAKQRWVAVLFFWILWNIRHLYRGQL
jgi:two-component system, LytTR family, sensor histidine kinase LytS